MIQNILITIFVPVFNGEKYLNETLISIQNQTYKNIEVLLVDDSSSDGSKIRADSSGAARRAGGPALIPPDPCCFRPPL